MRLRFFAPRVASLPDLRTYNCQSFGVTVTEAEEPKKRRDSYPRGRAASSVGGVRGLHVRIPRDEQPEER
jgi:hypothetical protein